MKPLHEYEPWKVVSFAFAMGIFLALAGLAFGLVLVARISAGTWGPYSLLLMGLGFGLAIATPALSAEFLHWLQNRRRKEEQSE